VSASRGILFLRRTLQGILEASTRSPRSKDGLAGGTKNRSEAIEQATNILAALEFAPNGMRKCPSSLNSLVAELRKQANNPSLLATQRVLACTRLAVIEGVLPTSVLGTSTTDQLIRERLGEPALNTPPRIAPSEPESRRKGKSEIKSEIPAEPAAQNDKIAELTARLAAIKEMD
jgi:hypothetical protein